MRIIAFPGGSEHEYQLTFEEDSDVGESFVLTSSENVMSLKCVPTRHELRKLKAWLECLGVVK